MNSTPREPAELLTSYRALATPPAELVTRGKAGGGPGNHPLLLVGASLPELEVILAEAAASKPDPRAESSDEPLVDVASVSGIIDLAAYAAAGWRDAVRPSLARVGALRRLQSAVESLPDDVGLAVFDAWRPLELQAALHHQAYDGTGLAPGYVSPPSLDPADPPPHYTGGTFDLTLTWQDRPLALGTSFDEFTPRAALAALEAELGLDRQLRRLLAAAMVSAGFAPYASEWWHWEYGSSRWAAFYGAAGLYGACSG